MIAEALKLWSDAARRSAAPQKLDIPDPRRAVYVVDGNPTGFDLPVPPRDHRAGSLEDLVNLANRFAAGGGFRPAVWYDHERVVLVIDDGTDGTGPAHPYRVERATLELEPSDLFLAVVKLRDGKLAFNQKDFVRLLRITLAGALDPVRLLNVIRRVKFESGTVVRSEKQRDRESMGREINSSVSAEGDIPEEVTLSLPVYKTLREDDRYPVRCSVEVEPMEGVFRLLPLPDEVERVRNLALESIEVRLQSGLVKDVPHYHGKP